MQTRHKNIAKSALATVSFIALTGCGNAGDAAPVTCTLCGTLNDVRGSLSTKTGSRAQMKGWVVTAFERDSGIARVGEVDDAGIYTLSHLRTDQAQTMALFTPDYILQSVVSIPGTADKTIRQYFTIQKPQMPRLINNGPMITLENLNGINILDRTSAGQAGDGTPDGVAKFNPASLNLADTGATPVDKNGVGNDRSPDVDGDGLINWLDPDDNGNGVLDIFDPDQNSDLVSDSTPAGHNTDQWFREGIEYIAVEFELNPKDDGTGNQTMLSFTTKIRDDVAPIAVQIRGAPSLLNGSTVTAKDSSGNNSSQAWDRLLLDDGSGQRVFTRQVVLANAGVPRGFQVVFVQLVFGTSDAPYYIEFPWAFPPIKPAAISAQYDVNTRNVQLVGNPFGAVQDFIWNIAVYDSAGSNVWSSQSIPGATRQFAIQANIIDPNQTYKYSVIAQSLDKVPGHPAYAIHSPKYNMK